VGERVGAVAAIVPTTGRYAVQGTQMRLGIDLWAERVGRQLVLADDESRPERAAELHEELLGRDYGFVLGPYGSDSTRAVAATRPGVLWNHGAAADDVQRLPGVVSLPSPASRYLIALGRAIAELHPGCRIALVTAAGPFAQFAREGIERAASSLGLEIVGTFTLGDDPEAIEGGTPDAVLACGSIGQELGLFRQLSIGDDIGLLAGCGVQKLSMKEGGLSRCVFALGVTSVSLRVFERGWCSGSSVAHLSIAPFDGDGSGWELLRWRNSVEDRHAVRVFAAPAGAKGWSRTSMYQIASASLRPTVIAAILVPRLRPWRAIWRLRIGW
jgi:hypothetical protein